ncbi:protein mono-ADP-ribosyltransferase PARP12-like [Penaeus japonicus]|uniref:protein mono-ADP-ribosyltransferase PARP12-like n=1 Tax=Penaeus japonicus TaxID=27405 RepID=UPI001C70C20F|nr:protein mono-ADP-ribosyltransferase PARP12-like [Penaeus japonicus]XP_042875138.1 protein mono-ADP-ribosyltransferase PARP12-like [Penaeus japonicus]
MGNWRSKPDAANDPGRTSESIKSSLAIISAGSRSTASATLSTSPYSPSAKSTSPYSPSAKSTSPYSPSANSTSPYSPSAKSTSPYSPSTVIQAASPHSTSSIIHSASPTNLQIKPTAKPAQQTAKHRVNNNYVIRTLHPDSLDQTQIVNIPLSGILDKFGLRVCPQYNSKIGCHAPLCRRYHICLSWVKGQCKRDNCDYAHSFHSDHNTCLERIACRRRNLTTLECLKDNHRRMRNKRHGMDFEICVFSIMNKCSKEDCSKVHAKVPYQWEVQIGNSWANFSRSQNSFLEEMFRQPGNENVKLPPLANNLRTHPAFSNFYSILSKSNMWFVNFETMELASQHKSMKIRRLSTASDITSDLSLATRWIWYWEDDNGVFHPYTDGDGEKFYIISLSDQMEYEKINARSDYMQVKICGIHYSINIKDMYQQNKNTDKIRKIRRRPSCLPRKQKNEFSFSDQFSTVLEDKDFMRHPVNAASSEFMYVKGLLQTGIGNIRIATMERIQNNHLWKAYQNKKKLLLSLYKNDVSLVNEQFMFHGTKHKVIDLICKESFDWRLFGSNVGNVFGKGTYFTNDSRVSNSYSESISGLKAVFVALILVGTITKGDRYMEVPPPNTTFDRCFDTTCNNDVEPNIFVKYNKDEYYPAYIVKYHDADSNY